MTQIISRTERFRELFPDAPPFRLRQMEEALFSEHFSGFADISSMPLAMREKMAAEMCWLAVEPVQVFESASKDTYKAVIETTDKKRIETVLMKNARGHFTVCVSSQVGCAMACTFCATGTMGFTRNLLSDEIVDQVRLWQDFLRKRPELPQYISNVVFMGMGEPLANYDNVKSAIAMLLKQTDIGQTRITVSTVGMLPMLRKLLDDPEWPPVRLAVSLHSADNDTRKRMMPTSFDGFLDELAAWSDTYFQKFDSKRRHLTFEYVMLSSVNDTAMHAEALIRFARRVGKARVNLIPYNFTPNHSRKSSDEQSAVSLDPASPRTGSDGKSLLRNGTGQAHDTYRGSLPGDFARFEDQLKNAGIDVTRRRSMGDDIAAACGQLVIEKGSV